MLCIVLKNSDRNKLVEETHPTLADRMRRPEDVLDVSDALNL